MCIMSNLPNADSRFLILQNYQALSHCIVQSNTTEHQIFVLKSVQPVFLQFLLHPDSDAIEGVYNLRDIFLPWVRAVNLTEICFGLF